MNYARVYTVAEAGGDFTSVATAIAAIPAGGGPYLIRVMAGTYNEPAFTVPSNVTLRGAGRDCCFLIVDGGIRLADSTLIQGFDIEMDDHQGIFVPCLTQDVTICDNSIMNSGTGITINGDGLKIIVHDNKIHDCQIRGIFVRYGNQPFIHDNYIDMNMLGGVYFDEAGGSLSNNAMFDNGPFGVLVTGMTNWDIYLTIDDNQIGYNDVGISLQWDYFETRVMGNDIFNGQYGIEVVSGNAHIVANTVSECQTAGVCVSGSNATAHIVGNNIWLNYNYGIDCAANAHGVVSSNIIQNPNQDLNYVAPT